MLTSCPHWTAGICPQCLPVAPTPFVVTADPAMQAHLAKLAEVVEALSKPKAPLTPAEHAIAATQRKPTTPPCGPALQERDDEIARLKTDLAHQHAIVDSCIKATRFYQGHLIELQDAVCRGLAIESPPDIPEVIEEKIKSLRASAGYLQERDDKIADLRAALKATQQDRDAADRLARERAIASPLARPDLLEAARQSLLNQRDAALREIAEQKSEIARLKATLKAAEADYRTVSVQDAKNHRERNNYAEAWLALRTAVCYGLGKKNDDTVTPSWVEDELKSLRAARDSAQDEVGRWGEQVAKLKAANKAPRCSCDADCDQPCPVHTRENALQNEAIALRNQIVSLKEAVEDWRNKFMEAQKDRDVHIAAHLAEQRLRLQAERLLQDRDAAITLLMRELEVERARHAPAAIKALQDKLQEAEEDRDYQQGWHIAEAERRRAADQTVQSLRGELAAAVQDLNAARNERDHLSSRVRDLNWTLTELRDQLAKRAAASPEASNKPAGSEAGLSNPVVWAASGKEAYRFDKEGTLAANAELDAKGYARKLTAAEMLDGWKRSQDAVQRELDLLREAVLVGLDLTGKRALVDVTPEWVIEHMDIKANGQLEAANAALLAGNKTLCGEVRRANAKIDALWTWSDRHGAALCPPAGSADSFGDGMRAAKQQVKDILSADGHVVLKGGAAEFDADAAKAISAARAYDSSAIMVGAPAKVSVSGGALNSAEPPVIPSDQADCPGALWRKSEPSITKQQAQFNQLPDWHRIDDHSAYARPFGTVRACRGCGCLVAGGPDTCGRCGAVEGAK